MKNGLKTRREKLVRGLDRINRQIVWTQKEMVRIESRIAVLQRIQARAA
jgi:hypothetical protein